MRIAIASDHAAVTLKADLAGWLAELGHEVNDLGPEGIESVDYPDYGYKLAEVVADGTAQLGVALCGTGIGISIAVNREPKCRCARVGNDATAQLAREHNDANVLVLPARFVGTEEGKAILKAWLDTPFAGGRHARRIAKIERDAERDTSTEESR